VFGVASLVRRRVASSLRDRSARPAWVTKEIVDVYARPVLRDISRSTALLRRLGNARESESIEDRARTIEVPVLLLLGDAMQPSRPKDDEVARMQAALRSFTVDTIANAGHYLQEEQPVEVVTRVVRMAAGVAAGAVGRSPDR
jgi:pimeloyl-ACP methyl ester carboxylesterase